MKIIDTPRRRDFGVSDEEWEEMVAEGRKLKKTTDASLGSWVFRFLDAYERGENWRNIIPTKRSH